jgi:hypothetical protein
MSGEGCCCASTTDIRCRVGAQQHASEPVVLGALKASMYASMIITALKHSLWHHSGRCMVPVKRSYCTFSMRRDDVFACGLERCVAVRPAYHPAFPRAHVVPQPSTICLARGAERQMHPACGEVTTGGSPLVCCLQLSSRLATCSSCR